MDLLNFSDLTVEHWASVILHPIINFFCTVTETNIAGSGTL